jgi:hypothetical protein
MVPVTVCRFRMEEDGRARPLVRQRLGWLAAALSASLLLAGCPSSPGDAEARRVRPPQPDISTPERALKSYWAQIDWFYLASEDHAKSGGTAVPPLHELMASVSTGDALKSFHGYTPRRGPLERTLERVTRDGERSAQVLARIRSQREPVPGSITPTPIELFERETGGEFRYELRDDGGGWKVAEVWRIDGASEPRRIR